MGGDDPSNTTVVIPVWGEYLRWLPRAVSSLREQEVPLRLVIVLNDPAASVPDLADAEVIRTDTQLTLGAARNLGLASVTTPYVVFWDADDVAMPGALGFLEQAMAGDRRLVAFAMAIEEAESRRRHRWPRRRISWMVRHPHLLALVHTIWSQFPTTGATMMRAEAARAGGGFSDEDSGDDWCLGVSLAFRGRVGWSERPGRLYHRHSNSIWSSYFTIRHQRRHAQVVRHRVWRDPAVPWWVKALIPVTWFGQNAALTAHSLVSLARRVGRRSD
jgi:glycosyltransferase involved in cell wall biosynthesis